MESEHPFDQFSETVSELLYRSWVEEVREAKTPHAFVWKYAWMKVWPSIRSEIAGQIVAETYKVPKPKPLTGLAFTILATACARIELMWLVGLVGILFLVIGVEWKRNARSDAGSG